MEKQNYYPSLGVSAASVRMGQGGPGVTGSKALNLDLYFQ